MKQRSSRRSTRRMRSRRRSTLRNRSRRRSSRRMRSRRTRRMRSRRRSTLRNRRSRRTRRSRRRSMKGGALQETVEAKEGKKEESQEGSSLGKPQEPNTPPPTPVNEPTKDQKKKLKTALESIFRTSGSLLTSYALKGSEQDAKSLYEALAYSAKLNQDTEYKESGKFFLLAINYAHMNRSYTQESTRIGIKILPLLFPATRAPAIVYQGMKLTGKGIKKILEKKGVYDFSENHAIKYFEDLKHNASDIYNELCEFGDTLTKPDMDKMYNTTSKQEHLGTGNVFRTGA